MGFSKNGFSIQRIGLLKNNRMNRKLYKVRPFASIKVRFQTRILEVVRNFKMSQQARAYTRVKRKKKKEEEESKRIREYGPGQSAI